MDILQKMDLIRERVDVSYEEAYQVLQEVDGDPVRALINLENKTRSKDHKSGQLIDQFKIKGQELLNKIKELIREGNIKKITVSNEERTLLEIPVTAGVVSLVIFPYLTVLAGMTALYKEYRLEIERETSRPEYAGSTPGTNNY